MDYRLYKRLIIIVMVCGSALAAWIYARPVAIAPASKVLPQVQTIVPESEVNEADNSKKALCSPFTRELLLVCEPNSDARFSTKCDTLAHIPTVKHPDDVAALVAVLINEKEDGRVRNEVANLLGRSKFVGLSDVLIQVLHNDEEEPRFRAFAAQHLGMQLNNSDLEIRSRVNEKVHNLVYDRHFEVRREALLALVRQKDPQAAKCAVDWLHDSAKEADITRDLAIRCVYDLELRAEIPTVRTYVRSPNEIIQIAAIVALSQWDDEESRSAFQEAAASKIVRVQRCGKAALQRLDKFKTAENDKPANTQAAAAPLKKVN